MECEKAVEDGVLTTGCIESGVRTTGCKGWSGYGGNKSAGYGGNNRLQRVECKQAVSMSRL